MRIAKMRNRTIFLLIVTTLWLSHLLLPSAASTSTLTGSPAQFPNHLPEQTGKALSDASFNSEFNRAQLMNDQNPPAQDQPIRVKTDLIDLRAVVTDKRGQPVTDLKKEDFELMENGKPQEVSFFSVIKIPGRGEERRVENSTAAAPPGAPA